MNEKLQKEYLLKIIEGNEQLAIPICDDNGTATGGVMRPITKMQLQSNDIIEKMTNWRNRYKAFFLTQFNATPMRTKEWLEKMVLSDPTQLMFLIYHEDTLIGQYGFKELTSDSVFLDNLLRGERGGHPLLMRYAVSALIKWLFDVMEVNSVYGYTFANNAMALKLNRDVGFSFTEKIPLQKQVDGEGIKWVVGRAGEPSPDNHYYQKIVMTRNSKSF
jgi:RimJ/RimL family protein N-acetyltransferase